MIARIIVVSLSYIVGIVLVTAYPSALPGVMLVGSAGVGAALSLYLMRDERRWRAHPRLLTALAAILLGLPLGQWRALQKIGVPRQGTLRHCLAELAPGARLTFRGWIHREPELRDEENADVRVRITELRTQHGEEWTRVGADNVMCRVYIDDTASPQERAAFTHIVDPRAYGYRVEGQATFRPSQPLRHPGEFDSHTFLRQNDLVSRFKVPIKNIHVTAESRGNPLLEFALWTKRHFIATYKVTIRGPASRLVAAATLGTRRAVENVDYRGMDITQTFRHAGVGHVLAVSGLHVSVIAVLLYSIFWITGMRPRVFAPILIACLILFALLTGARPSSVRAVVMNSVILIAFAYFRYGLREATYIGLSLSALGILLVNPLILFAPSFLLSFGAVTSLVLIAGNLDRWIRLLRGFSLFFFAFWCAGIIALASLSLPSFLSSRNCLGMLGALWLLIKAGNVLNRRFPGAWSIGMERVPAILRMLISAQIAIQVGMMVPLSAWFFGQFPVVGVLVNLFAIPAIGVLVQLGMMVGLLGLVPVIGPYLALPFGAADSLVGEFFFRIAHAGATAFPFPAMPKPTLGWMAAYYITVGAVLIGARCSVHIQGWLYRLASNPLGRRVSQGATWALAAGLFLLPVTRLLDSAPQCEAVTCLAAGRNPLIAITFSDGEAIVVNGGDRMDGGRLLFEIMRMQGATVVDTAVLCGPQPEAGNEGLAALAEKVRIRTCYAPFAPENPADYLDAIGDPYLRDDERRGEPFVERYVTAYTSLVEALTKQGTAVHQLPSQTVVGRGDVQLEILPPPAKLPSRYVSSALTRLVHADIRGVHWLIVSDSDPDALRDALASRDSSCDILVLPDHSSRGSSFHRLIDTAVELTSPRVVVLSGERTPSRFDPDKWAREHGTFVFFNTARDGAVMASFPAEDTTQLTGFLSRKTVLLMSTSE